MFLDIWVCDNAVELKGGVRANQDVRHQEIELSISIFLDIWEGSLSESLVSLETPLRRNQMLQQKDF